MSNITKNVQENMTRYENLLYKTVGKSFLNNYQLWFSIELIIFMIGMIAIGAWGIISNWYENYTSPQNSDNLLRYKIWGISNALIHPALRPKLLWI